MQFMAGDCDWIEQRATAHGFDAAGVAAVFAPDSEDGIREDLRFSKWISSGGAGEMEYLKRVDASGDFVRGALRRAMPWARSVIVCAANYNSISPRSIDAAEPGTGWIARYAWSGSTDAGEASDYHDVLLPLLRKLEDEMQQRFGTDLKTRCYVDTGPIVERAYAARAGTGWIGKNTCILNQEKGSWLLLGVIVTSMEVSMEQRSVPAADRCGSCTRCIDACPTDALAPSREQGRRGMDGSRCIAYLTIEHKGSIPEDLRELMGRNVFGCDICQDVCPWNRRAVPPEMNLFPVRPALVNPALEWLAAMDGATFNRVFRGSPIERTRRKRMLRNVAIAMGNSGSKEFLRQLTEWANADDAVLAETARWALKRLDEAPKIVEKITRQRGTSK